MAPLFAILDDNNIIINTLVGNNFDLTTEEEMSNFLSKDVSKIKKYSQDGSYLNRGIPIIGGTYLVSNNYFKPIQFFSSWTYNEEKRMWEAPVPAPESFKDTYNYWWDEVNLRWIGYVKNVTPRLDFIWNSDTNSWENL